jgi:phage N-6-adenine-methyltransferase
MSTNVHFLSGNGEWGTPQELFSDLDDIFQFDLDAAANEHNHKCEKWLGPNSSIAEDALSEEVKWEGTIFLNPPYGRGIRRWTEKAYKSSLENGATVVCVLPARTDTQWFETCWKASFVCFVKGRLRFEGASAPAPFPSCIVVFGRNLPNDLEISMLAGEGTVVRPMWLYNPIDRMRFEWMRDLRERREQDGF